MYHASAKIINQSDPIFLCRGTHCSWQTFSENQDQEVISFTFEVTEEVVTGVGTADWGDPELVLMRRPLVDTQLCLLLCYLGASHRDPGGVIMPAGQGAEGAEGAEGKPKHTSLGPLAFAHLRTCVYMHAHQGAEVP